MSMLAVPPPSKLEYDACGMAYDEGLLYCSPIKSVCFDHKLGSDGWTQPSEMQPGFVAQEPGCAIIGGKLWMSGGSPTLGKIMLDPVSMPLYMLCFVVGRHLGYLVIAGSINMISGVSRPRHLLMRQSGVTP